MTQRFSSLFSALLSLSLLLVTGPLCWADEATRRADIQRELDEAVERMMQIWPGQYDNSEQMIVDQRRGYTSWRDGGHVDMHSAVVVVDNPGVGEHLLYVEDSMNGDTNNIFRQKLYQLSTDVDRAAVVLTLHSFVEPERVSGALKNPSLLKSLKSEDLKQRPGCEMYFRPLGSGYSGAFDYGACTTTTDAGIEVVADNRMYIEPGHYWFSDQFRPAGAPRPHATIEQNWHRLVRAGGGAMNVSARQ